MSKSIFCKENRLFRQPWSFSAKSCMLQGLSHCIIPLLNRSGYVFKESKDRRALSLDNYDILYAILYWDSPCDTGMENYFKFADITFAINRYVGFADLLSIPKILTIFLPTREKSI